MNKVGQLGIPWNCSLTVHWPQEAIIGWTLSKQVSPVVKSRDGGWGALRWAPSASGTRRRRCRAAGLTARVTPLPPTATQAMTRTSDTSQDTGWELNVFPTNKFDLHTILLDILLWNNNDFKFIWEQKKLGIFHSNKFVWLSTWNNLSKIKLFSKFVRKLN